MTFSDCRNLIYRIIANYSINVKLLFAIQIKMFEFDKSKFGERVTAIRNAKSKSRRSLAKDIGVSDAAIQKYEEGKSVPAFDIAARLAFYGEKSIVWLLTGEDEINPSVLNNETVDIALWDTLEPLINLGAISVPDNIDRKELSKLLTKRLLELQNESV